MEKRTILKRNYLIILVFAFLLISIFARGFIYEDVYVEMNDFGTNWDKANMTMNCTNYNISANNITASNGYYFVGNGSLLTGVSSSVNGSWMANWNTSYDWGNHSLVGYLTGWSDGDPFFNVSNASKITQVWMDLWNASSSGGSGGLNMSNITNSNNNEWPVTEGNVELAINNVGTTGWVNIGSNIAFTSTINATGHDGVLVNCLNNVITPPSGSTSLINITDANSFGFVNAVINVDTQTGNIIQLYSGTDATRVDYFLLANLVYNNIGGTISNYNGSGLWVYKEHNYTGIEFYGDADGGTGRVFKGLISNVVFEGADVGIRIKTSGTGYVNGLTFIHTYFDQWYTACVEFVEDASSNGANNNVFYSPDSQTAVYSHYGFKNISGDSNRIKDSLMWDFSVSDSGVYAYWVNSSAVNTVIEDVASSSFQYVFDEGLGSIIECGGRSLYYDSDYDYKVTRVGDYYYVRYGDYGYMPVSGADDRTMDFQDLMEGLVDHDNILIKLENGTFEPDRYIAIDNENITIEGRPDYSTVIKIPDGDAMASGIFNANGVGEGNLTLRYLVFDCSDASASSIGVYFSSSENMSGLVVDRCIFIGFDVGTSKAIYVRPSTDDVVTNVKVMYSKFFDCDFGISFDGDSDPSIIQYSDISHNYFDGCDVCIYLDYVSNSTAIGNVFKDVGTSDVSFGSGCVDNFIFNMGIIDTDVVVDDCSIYIENGTFTWKIYVNATGTLVWEWD